MGSTPVDIEIQCFLADGFDYIRAHPEVIDEIFARWNDAHIAKRYSTQRGVSPTDTIKAWVKDNNIPVVLGFGDFAIKLPCVSIHLAHSGEKAGEATFFGDHAGFDVVEDTRHEANLVVDNFIPKSYDPKSGKIVVAATTDLTNVREGMILVDAKAEEYLIQVVGDNFITIVVDGQAVNIKSLYIKSEQGYVRRKQGASHFTESIDIGLHASEEAQTVLWLYYMASWIFFRFKPVLEQRGLEVHTFTASDFDRDSKFVGEKVFSRWLRFSCDSVTEWTEDPLDSFSQRETIVSST
jgi:hypothetical protein